MTLAEYLYWILLRLYPEKHRQAYGQQMLQLARDLCRAARQRGRWQVAFLSMHLFTDGITNAAIEQFEAIKMANNRIKPAPWLIVFLACIPGLMVALTRRQASLLDPFLPILVYIYLGLLVIGVPLLWWKNRSFPVWALLPAGAVLWTLTYIIGTGLSQLINSSRVAGLGWIGIEAGIAIVNILIILGIAAIFLHFFQGERVPGSIRLVITLILLVNISLLVLYSISTDGGIPSLADLLAFSGMSGLGLVDGLMVVAVGMLAARQHGVIALLFVVGGYIYMFMDSDYFSAFTMLDWRGLSLYLISATLLFLVVVPVGLLRAKTRLGRALAVFLPVVIFQAARITIPFFVNRLTFKFYPGEIILSMNVFLCLLLAWYLYSYIGDRSNAIQLEDSSEESPLPIRI